MTPCRMPQPLDFQLPRLHLSLNGVGAELFHHLRRTFSWTPRSRAACTAQLDRFDLNSRLDFRLRMTASGCMKHPISVSIKPAAAQGKNRAQLVPARFGIYGAERNVRELGRVKPPAKEQSALGSRCESNQGRRSCVFLFHSY